MNATGASEWTNVTATTKSDPLEFAIHGIKGETTCPNQGGQGVNKLFNFDEGDTWHTKWSTAAVPFDLIVDLNSVNQLDKFQYLPRLDAGNGTLGKGTVYYSMDKSDWHEAGTFDWKGSDVKTFDSRNSLLHAILSCRLYLLQVSMAQVVNCMYSRCLVQKAIFQVILTRISW